jgi:WD40 repeat protein
VALGCVNGNIKVLDCVKGVETHSYKIHNGQIFKLLFHPIKENYLIISAGEDYAIRIYDMVVSRY